MAVIPGELDSPAEKKVHLISLGCARNRVDSEVMLGSLSEDKWSHTNDPNEADAIIVNTCGFIDKAKEESVETILEAAEYKSQRPDTKVVVAGCLTQRYKGQLAKGFPEIDLFLGTDEFSDIAGLLKQDLPKGTVRARRTKYLYDGELPKLNTLGGGAAYVKVAEGCQHRCSFCIIPAIRGPLRSRSIESVVAEAKKLASEGVFEINLIAQDLAAYGRDLGDVDLLMLLKSLVAIDGIEWIRMLYVYPENIDEDFLAFWQKEKKLLPYIDIPMQHGHDDVLKRMNRHVTRKELLETIARVRQVVPGVAIRTSVMVGFPGETHEEFLALKEFIREAKFDHLGCFIYSPEEGTVAGRMKDQVDPSLAQERLDEVMTLQKELSEGLLQKYVGRTLPVLIKGLSEESDLLYEGRIAHQAPEVDGVVYINDGQVKPGTIQMVTITEAHEYDLVGHITAPVDA